MDAALHTISQARELAPSMLMTEESETNGETQNPTSPPRPNQQQPGEPAAAAGIPADIYCTNAHQQHTSRHQWQMWVENVGAIATRLFGTVLGRPLEPTAYDVFETMKAIAPGCNPWESWDNLRRVLDGKIRPDILPPPTQGRPADGNSSHLLFSWWTA